MPIPSSPTLIIGLGGVGSRIVEGVYRQFMAREPQPIDVRNVQFLCLDTDEADVNERKKVMPENNVVKTSSDLSDSISGYIARIQNNTDVENWFDISSMELLGMPLNKGAAQVRMASRLALMSAISEGKLTAIDNSINLLMANDPERHQGNNIRIFIVTSLAGGTGAGSFLQTAYYVKNSMIEHGAGAPEITGFFLLADVLCDDTSKGFSDDQKENVRSNTYACMKELVAFSSSDRDESLKTIEFEYRLGQKDLRLPANMRPYDICFLVDYTAATGENLGVEERYESQVESFVFLTAFSPTGDRYRSLAINDVRQRIQSDGSKMFSGLGVSKLVYPVDDLFGYFARQRVVDNMDTTWRIIDKDYEEKYEEYRDNKREGIPTEEPQKGLHYRQMVEDQAKLSGLVGAEFREIYRSTQILDQDLNPIQSKANVYVNELIGFVNGKIDTSVELVELARDCRKPSDNFLNQDVFANDQQFITSRERALYEYRRGVETFIDNMKRTVPKQCFLADHDLDNFVSRTPDMDKHHLNTYILPKDEELHPIAVRYFLYDLRDEILPLLAQKRTDNEALRSTIYDGYEKAYDNPDTKNTIESASDGLREAHDKEKGILKKAVNMALGQNSTYRQTKINYDARSKQQAENIKKYAHDKLLEETLSAMLNHINRLLEESENFFDGLPLALEEVKNECAALLTKHDGHDDKDVTYVLASEHIKKDIYKFVISKDDSPFFPSVMSAALYRSMYDNVCKEIEGNKYQTSRQIDEETKKKNALEANKTIILNCVEYQDTIIRESNRDYATKNVMAALKEEAMRECFNDNTKAKDYMEHKFKMFRDQARIWGPDNLGTEVRHINAWGLHPDCISTDVVSATDANTLFGSERVDTTAENAASRLVSEFFTPFEIVRADSVTLLHINQHFKKFHKKNRTDLENEYFGPYYKAYHDVVKRVFETSSNSRARVEVSDDGVIKDCSPHLDKRWHLPAYMPDIGSTNVAESKKLFNALCYGLLFGCFKAVYSGGEYYWKHIGSILKWIRDLDGRLIGLGQSLDGAINNLFEKGLVNNPGIVDEVMATVDLKWKQAKEEWLDTDRDEKNELEKMKALSLVKNILGFDFSSCTLPETLKTSKNWFSLFNARRGSNLQILLSKNDNYLIDQFLKEFVEKLIGVFGQSVNTHKVCKYIFENVGAEFKDNANRILEDLDKEGRFEPQI
jgi:hypothetical protein